MSYLAKIEIDHETAYKAGLRDSYAWHQKSWLAFPGRDSEERDFLTRLDEIDGGFRLLLLSATSPIRPAWCPEPSWECKEIAPAFFTHATYRFSLMANPAKKVRSAPDGRLLKNSRRVGLSKREDLLDWLRRKGEAGGFTFEAEKTHTIPRPRQAFLKKGQAGLHTATEFIGLLTVTDASAFQEAVTQGIGPAKAFGFGMLCLSPV
jgi:CRISPR system Cascade subunit CasE